jgi:hypothetical protein
MNKFNNIIICLITAFFLISCTSSTEKINKLEDRNFYFQKFRYAKKGMNKKEVFEIMKNFPTDKILKIISHKYNIPIDSSDFNDFILLDNSSLLQTKGMIFDAEYIWENNKHMNIIEIEYIEPLASGPVVEEKKYLISIKANDKNLDEILCYPNDKKPILVSIAGSLGYSRQKENSDDYYVNNENKSVVNLISVIPSATKGSKDKISKEAVKMQIKEYVKTLSKDEKIKFRDDIIKFLYSAIE